MVEASCGGEQCHSGVAQQDRDHIQRALTSIQSTYAGAIANIRFTFGAQTDLTPIYGIRSIQDEQVISPKAVASLLTFDPAAESSPAVQKFAENCLDCHLWAQPPEGRDYARLSGCAACHTPTAGLDITPGSTQLHRLTTSISYAQCNTCHNRGNYDLRTMTFAERADQPTDRLHDYYQPIAQFVRCEWTLDCIDCHTRIEAMGDGDLYGSKKDIQYTQCRTCHGTLDELPLTYTITSLDDLALRQAFLNPVLDLKVGDTILVTEKGEPLWNIRPLEDGTYEMYGKASGQLFRFNPVMGSGCQQNPDEQEFALLPPVPCGGALRRADERAASQTARLFEAGHPGLAGIERVAGAGRLAALFELPKRAGSTAPDSLGSRDRLSAGNAPGGS